MNRKHQRAPGKPWRAEHDVEYLKRRGGRRRMGGGMRRAAPRVRAKSRPRPMRIKRGPVRRTVSRSPRVPVRRAVRRRASIRKPVRRGVVVKRTPPPKRPAAPQRKPRPRPATRPVSKPPVRKQVVKPRPNIRRAHPKPSSMRGDIKRRPPRRKPPSRPPRSISPAGVGVPGGAVAGMAAAAGIAASIAAVAQSASALEARASMSDVQADVTRLNELINSLPDILEDIRERGYEFGKDLEPRVDAVFGQWQAALPRIDDAVYKHAVALSQDLSPIQDSVYQLSATRADTSRAEPLVGSLQLRIQQLESQARSAESAVESLYSSISSEAYALQRELNRLDAILDLFEESSFDLAEEESPVAAVKAKYDTAGKDDPEGNLFLTDQRLIFERNEEEVIKKVLFIVTEKQLVQEVLVEVAEDNIQSVQASKRGLGGHEDHLDFEFKDEEVERAHFHIDGQDADEWERLVKDVMSGKIEDDVAVLTGISIAELSGPVTQADMVALQNEANELQKRVQLGFVKNAIEDLEVKVGSMERQLADVRARGYMFESDLEDEIRVLSEQWTSVKADLNSAVESQSGQLRELMSKLLAKTGEMMGYASQPARARPLFLEAQSLVSSLAAQAAAAEGTLEDQYDDFQVEVDTVTAHLEWVDWTLAALSSAAFRLGPIEGGVAATEASWVRSSSTQAGILYLTDQRLLFEEREGEFSVLLEARVQQIEDVDALSDQGESKAEEHLVVKFGPEAPTNKALFILHGPEAEEWQQMIGRARGGDYVADRAVEIDPAELERLAAAPTSCPACGSAYSERLIKGQHEITCQYCGTVTRF